MPDLELMPLLAHAPTGFLLIDAQGLVTACNPRAVATLGSPIVPGTHLSLLFPASQRVALQRFFERAQNEDPPLSKSFPAAPGQGMLTFSVASRSALGVLLAVTAEPAGPPLAQKQAEQALLLTQAALTASESRFRRVVAANLVGFLFWSEDGTITDANDAFLTMVGHTRAELLAGSLSWRTMTPPEFAFLDQRALAEIARFGTCAPMEKEYLRKDGSRISVLLCACCLDGDPGKGVCLIIDTTEHKRAERASRLLLSASKLLASSLELPAVLSHLARIVVPDFADWCIVDLIQQRGKAAAAARLLVLHRDESKAALALELQQHCPPDPHGIGRVLQSGKPGFFPDFTEEQLVASLHNPRHRELVRKLGVRSCICVPLLARDKVLGAISFALGDSERRYGHLDLALAEDLASHAALSVDNARLYQEAREAIKTREEFLSIASHELRAPLTPLQLQVQMLMRNVRLGQMEEVAPARLQGKLEACERHIKRLAKLIHDLLDVSRISAGRLELHREEVDLSALVRDVVGRSGPELSQSGSVLTVDLPEHCVGQWDRLRLEQVVTNLLTNAVQYGRGQPIRISLDLSPPAQDGQDDQPQAARLRIADQGMGIPREFQERIFNRFERGAMARSGNGLGLGLYIVKQILDAMGGTIDVASEVEAGAVFTVQLPCRISA